MLSTTKQRVKVDSIHSVTDQGVFLTESVVQEWSIVKIFNQDFQQLTTVLRCPTTKEIFINVSKSLMCANLNPVSKL